MFDCVRLRNALAATGMFLLLGCSSSSSTGAPQHGTKPLEIPRACRDNAATYLDAINAARSVPHHCGDEGDFPAAKPLTWNISLCLAAHEHNVDMARSGIVHRDHTGSGTLYDRTAQQLHPGQGSTFSERIKANGYGSWKDLGENLTAGKTIETAYDAVDRWLESDRHCANLMSPLYTEVGMAHLVDRNSTYLHYWTQDFGAKH